MKQQRLQREIEANIADRLGRECVFMPSGRIALYCALRTHLKAGDALLMSPVNDDVIYFTVLAAGVRPVMAPLSADDGNIDVEAVPAETWSRVRGVLTTNLYGLPDRVEKLRERCAALGIPLIEDVAHAIETSVGGKPLGSFGTAAAFSLSKHVDAGCGGVLALGDGSLRRDIEALRDGVVMARGPLQLAGDFVKPRARAVLDALGVTGALRSTRLVEVLLRAERGSAHRMDLHADELRRAIAQGAVLDAFEPWVRVDRNDYRMMPGVDALKRILARLRRLDADREERIRAVERLRRELDLVAPVACRGEPLPLFRVPLLVTDRDAVRAELGGRGFWAHYIYDPPLDDYAGAEFADPSPAPDAARWWARHVLPVNPLRADIVIAALRSQAPARALWAGAQ
ncbi:MAG: DegT/DnrJ/EryC1/StrS family aminotransferase [Betaproteobacteria bacterium]|nr:DegT/DnrJ/EryC1/StrS family aminotransferase [Betaproteobacteria bacterium]